MTVTAGTLDQFDTRRDGNQHRRIAKAILHSEYALIPYTAINDICLLIPEEPFEFNDVVQKVEIGDYAPEMKGNCVIAGWGTVSVMQKSHNLCESLNNCSFF